MRLHEIDFGAALPIEGYRPGLSRIGGFALVSLGLTVPWGGKDDEPALNASVGHVAVLAIGTGPVLAPAAPARRDQGWRYSRHQFQHRRLRKRT